MKPIEALETLVSMKREEKEHIQAQRDRQFISKEFAKQKIKAIDKEIQLLYIIKGGNIS